MSAAGFTNAMSKFGRGSLAGTVAVTGMGRALAFASLQFLGGYGLFKGLTSSTAAAIRFGGAMTQLQTQAGASVGEVRRMTDAVLKLAPSVGTGPEDLAKGLYHIESSSIHGARALQTLQLAAEGAKVGHADLETVTNALVAAQKSGVAGAQDLTKTMGTLNAIVGSGNMRMEDLARSLGTGVLPAGRNFGVGLKDIGAALTILTRAGVPAQVAATRLRTTLGFLGGLQAPTTKALKTIGLSSLELARTLRTQGLIPALDLLRYKLQSSGLSAEKQAAVITKAFGAARSSTTVSTLIQQLPELRTSLDQITAHSGDFGKSWAATMKTAEFSMEKLHAAVQTLEIMVGQSLEPIVTRLANHFSVWLSKSENQRKVQESVSSAVKGTVTVVEKFYNVLNNLSKLFGGFTKMVEFFIALKLITVFANWTTVVIDFAKYLGQMAKMEKDVAGATLTMTAAQKTQTAATVAQGAAAAATTKEFEGLAAASLSANSVMKGSALAAAVPTAALGASAVAVAPPAAAVAGDAFAGYAGVAAGRKYATDLRFKEAQAVRYSPGLSSAGKALLLGSVATPSISQSLPKLEVAAEKTAVKVGYMSAAAGLAGKALGRAGLVGVVGTLSYTVASMVFQATGFNKVLGHVAGWLSDLHAPKLPPVPKQATVTQVVREAKQSIDEAGTIGKLQQANVTVQWSKEHPFPHKEIQDSIDRAKLVANLVAKFHLTKHDAEIFVNEAALQLQREMNIRKLIWKAVIQTGGKDVLNPNLTTDHPDVQKHFTPIKPPGLDFLSKLNDRMAQAQLDLAKGDQSAQQRIVAILRQRIDYDEKYARIQEKLIKTDVKNQKDHAAMVAKLRGDEAQSFQQINDALKNSFAVPQKLQIEQAQASATSSSADDIKVAKRVAASVMKAIRSGRLTGDALVSAWNEWAGAMQTINSQTKTRAVPMKLQLEQAEASITASTADDVKAARKIAAWARTQLKTAKGQERLNLLGILKDALDRMQKSFAVPLQLQVNAAQAALTSGTADDRKAAQAIYNYAKRQLARGKKLHDLQMQLDALAVMGQEKDVLNQGGGVATAYTMASTHNLTARFKGLSRSQRVAAEQQLAQVEAHHGRVPTAGFRGANGQVVNTGDTTININGGDLKEVERVVLKVLQKNDRHTSPQRRGRYSGTRPG